MSGLCIANAAMAEELPLQLPDFLGPYEGTTEHAIVGTGQAFKANVDSLGVNTYRIMCTPENTAILGKSAYIVLNSFSRDDFQSMVDYLPRMDKNVVSDPIIAGLEMGVITPQGELKTDRTVELITELYQKKADGSMPVEGLKLSSPMLPEILDRAVVKLCMNYS